MPVMYSFMFWFSVRLGSIIVAVFTLCQSAGVLIACSVGMENKSSVSEELNNVIRQTKLEFMAAPVSAMRDDPEPFLIGMVSFFSTHGLSSILLIFGAYSCQLILVYPFVVLELTRLLLMSALFIVSMLLLKENVLDLGLLIAACSGGAFVLLFFYYMWLCIVSLCQIVRQLEGAQEGTRSLTSEMISSEPVELNSNPSYGLTFRNHSYRGLSKPVY